MQDTTKPEPQGSIGQGLDRVDGRLKVTGAAKYAAEFPVHNVLHASLLQSTISKGNISTIDVSAAKAAPGVIEVLTYQNAPRMPKPSFAAGDGVPILQENKIYYNGQHIAVVVAKTLEQAEHGVQLIRVTYDVQPHEVDIDKSLDKAFMPGNSGRQTSAKRGDYESAFASAEEKVDYLYITPQEHHNPMEPHATIAAWTGNKLTVYDATQGVVGSAGNLAQQFGLVPEDVHLMSPFLGGGFGCKGQSWPHTVICAMAAKVVQAPVKLSLTREQMFYSNGYRPPTRQSMSLGASKDGKLVAMRHSSVNQTSQLNTFVEPTSSTSSISYSVPNVAIEQKLVRLDVNAPTYMRAPGESSGSFSIETAMDEMAEKVGMDPIEFRLKNYAEHDESTNKNWSSKHLKECYAQGAEAFGWSRRGAVGSAKTGNMLVGYGMAGATYPANFRTASAKARYFADGTAMFLIATQDIGTGTYTILTQIGADGLGVNPKVVTVKLGDSTLPAAPGSGGSQSAASAGSAVQAAAKALQTSLFQIITGDEKSPLHGVNPMDLEAKNGEVTSKKDPSKKDTFANALNRAGQRVIEADATAQPGRERGQGGGSSSQSNSDPATQPSGYSFHSFGAQFCEVHIDPDLREIRIAKWVGAFANGRILNEKTLRSQFQGGIVFGIGMALMEETRHDSRYGRYVNSNLAEYHVPVNADIPDLQVIMVEEHDPIVNPIGVKGAGEIGITGAAAAVCNAVYNATGKRVRDLPITLDKIL